jgi:hypothetical protein
MPERKKARVYAVPQSVTDLGQCYFYHTMDIPGYGLVEGPWDLREASGDYIGGVNLEGARVLEIGPASGFLTFFMESQGADVVSLELCANDAWDVVPYCNGEAEHRTLERKERLSRLNNSYWLCHKAYDSRAKLVYSSVYDLPDEIGAVDVALMSAVLRHVREPFRALDVVAGHTTRTLIVTEPVELRYLPLAVLTELLARFGLWAPLMSFAPDLSDYDTWWYYTPAIIRRFFEVLGFEDQRVTFHRRARTNGRRVVSFTVVGHRTRVTCSNDP